MSYERCMHGMVERYCGDCGEPPKGCRIDGVRPDDWTFEERTLLQDHVNDYPEESPVHTVVELARLLTELSGRERTVKAVGQQIWLYRKGIVHLREQRYSETLNAKCFGEEWSPTEIRKALDPLKTAHQIALDLGRTAAAVTRIRREYGDGRDYRRKGA